MPRPPKRINPQAHKTADHSIEDGRAFKKGRFGATGETPTAAPVPEVDATVVDVGDEDTATHNAAFTTSQAKPATGEVRQPRGGHGSKYDARPTTAAAPREARAPEDVTVNLGRDDESTDQVVVDLTKLPPVDTEGGSDTVYIRHSEGWPTNAD